MFRNIFTFYCEELLVPLLNPKMEDHTLSAVRDYVIYSQVPSITLDLLRHATWGRDISCWKGPT